MTCPELAVTWMTADISASCHYKRKVDVSVPYPLVWIGDISPCYPLIRTDGVSNSDTTSAIWLYPV